MKIFSYLDDKNIDSVALHIYLLEKIREDARKRYAGTTDGRKLARLKSIEDLYDATLLYGEQVASEYFAED